MNGRRALKKIRRPVTSFFKKKGFFNKNFKKAEKGL